MLRTFWTSGLFVIHPQARSTLAVCLWFHANVLENGRSLADYGRLSYPSDSSGPKDNASRRFRRWLFVNEELGNELAFSCL
jgi:hypothetical protein